VDRVQHVAQASRYFRHLNPKYTVSFGFEPCLPAQVVCRLRLVPMDRTVDFNRQSRPTAVEVDEVGADWLLAPEHKKRAPDPDPVQAAVRCRPMRLSPRCDLTRLCR